MSQPGAIAALAATCHRIAESLPAAQVAAARQRLPAALAEMADAGTSRDPDFLTATGELAALMSDLDAVTATLAGAAGQVVAALAQMRQASVTLEQALVRAHRIVNALAAYADKLYLNHPVRRTLPPIPAAAPARSGRSARRLFRWTTAVTCTSRTGGGWTGSR